MATPPTYARGVARQITLAPETTYGLQAAGPGQNLRRTSFTLDLAPPRIDSTEITPDSQTVDVHLGVPLAQASLSGQLSPGTYKSLFEGLLRGTWTVGVTVTATDSSSTINGTTSIVTFGSAAQNFLTAGFKKGDVFRLTGLTGGATALNTVNMRAVDVQAHSLIAAPNAAVTAWTSGGQTSVTFTVPGKKLYPPLAAAQVDRSFSIEDWMPEIAISRLATGMKPTSISMAASPNGWTNFQCAMIGKNVAQATAQVYASATAQSTSIGLRGAAGAVSYAGADLAYITSFNLQLAAAAQPVPAIGSLTGAPNIFMGMITARGSIQALLTNDTLSADFINEAEVDLALYLPISAAAGSDFISVYLGRVRLDGDTRQDGDRAITRSLNFGGLRQIGGGTGTAWDNTSLVIQDSLA